MLISKKNLRQAIHRTVLSSVIAASSVFAISGSHNEPQAIDLSASSSSSFTLQDVSFEERNNSVGISRSSLREGVETTDIVTVPLSTVDASDPQPLRLGEIIVPPPPPPPPAPEPVVEPVVESVSEAEEVDEKEEKEVDKEEKSSKSGDESATSSEAKGIAASMLADYGWEESEFSCLEKLWQKESGWNYLAKNPSSSATGIPQAMVSIHFKNSSAREAYLSSPTVQIKWGLDYIDGRYSSPCGAWSHSQGSGWY